MFKQFYRKPSKEIRSMIRRRVAYKLKTHFITYSIAFCIFFGFGTIVLIKDIGFDAFAISISSLISTALFVPMFMFPESRVMSLYFRFRVMDYVTIIDDDDYLFSYRLFDQDKEVKVRRDEILEIKFINSADDVFCFNHSNSTYKLTRKLWRFHFKIFHPRFSPKKMKLDLVKFIKPEHQGEYYREITEYIIPEFFERQGELMEALHKLADNFKKRKRSEFGEES